MNDPMLPLPGLSPVSGKRVEVKFDGGLLSSDGGVLALREVEWRLGVVSDDLPICHPARPPSGEVVHAPNVASAPELLEHRLRVCE